MQICNIGLSQNWHTDKLFEKFKCKFKSENIERSWDTFIKTQHFKGERGVLELWNGIKTSDK
jgi:hypothetical protein